MLPAVKFNHLLLLTDAEIQYFPVLYLYTGQRCKAVGLDHQGVALDVKERNQRVLPTRMPKYVPQVDIPGSDWQMNESEEEVVEGALCRWEGLALALVYQKLQLQSSLGKERLHIGPESLRTFKRGPIYAICVLEHAA